MCVCGTPPSTEGRPHRHVRRRRAGGVFAPSPPELSQQSSRREQHRDRFGRTRMKQNSPFSFAPIVVTLLLLTTAGCVHHESSIAAPPPPPMPTSATVPESGF